ncbi:MAG: hypothetical protein R3C05_15270 [Pirellulaceae bacterium]
MPSLQSLDCSGTGVRHLAPLSGLTSLQSLDCGSTQVSDLRSTPADIQVIYAHGLALDAESLKVIARPGASGVFRSRYDDSWNPPEVRFLKQFQEGCSPRLRSHLADLQHEPKVQTHDVKLIVASTG